MNKDTVEFKIYVVDTASFKTNNESGEYIAPPRYEIHRINKIKGHALIDLAVVLNSKEIEQTHIDVRRLFLDSLDSSTYWEKGNSKYSSFYLFSCSCGAAGCAGIYDGIHVRNRKFSIEWRMKKEDGYDFLEKNFYSFDKNQYIAALKKAKKDIEIFCEKLGDKFIVNPGHYEGDEHLGSDFLIEMEEIKNYKGFHKKVFW